MSSYDERINKYTQTKFILPIEGILTGSWCGVHDFWEGLLNEIFVNPSYDIPILSEHNLNIIDLGANVGVSLDYFNRNNNKVYGIEGSNYLFQSLIQTKNINPTWENVQVYHYVVSDMIGEVDFGTLLANATGSCRADLKLNNHEYLIEKVPAITFDLLLRDLGLNNSIIHLLKVDIEGSEHLVLNKQFLKHDNIKNIVVETHNDLDREIIPCLETKYSYSFLRDSGSQKVIWFQNGN